jgi:poly(3-hydroxybutyrate) depolymerase
VHDLLAYVRERKDVPMKTRLGVVLVCGLGIAFAGCGSDTGGRPGATPDGAVKPDAAVDARADVSVDSGAGVAVDAGILPSPVLDPNGTYGGKTYGEWLAAWWKHYLELPDATGVVSDTTGAYCAVGQSAPSGDGGTGTDAFLLGSLVVGRVTLNCTIPLGEMIFVPLFAGFGDNSGVPEGNLTDEQLKANLMTYLASVTGLSLEIDGVSYGSKVSDFAAYLIEPTQFSYSVPDTPTNIWSAPGWGPYFSGAVPNSFCAGYGILIAPLSAGSHTIHVGAVADLTYNETYNLTVADTSTLGSIDGGPSVDVPNSGAAEAGAFAADASVTEGGDGPTGCGLAGVPIGVFSKQTITVGDRARTYVLSVPEGYSPNTPLALVFGWHGRGGTGLQAQQTFAIEPAAAGGAIFVYPDAAYSGPDWDYSPTGIDVDLFDALVSYLAGSYCIDRNRIFSTGLSAGAYFTNLLGCSRGDVLRAIAPVAGGLPGALACAGNVGAWIAHASNDDLVDITTVGIPERDFWVSRNGCSTTLAPVAVDPSDCVEYQGCLPDLPVVWCVHTEGHNWPTSMANCRDGGVCFDAGPAVWAFFARFK